MRTRELLTWIAATVAAALAIAFLLPRAFPLFPRGWQVERDEAEAIARAQIKQLGPIAKGALVSVSWRGDPRLEHAILSGGEPVRRRVAGTRLAAAIHSWTVIVYPPQAAPSEWEYMVRLSPRGEVTQLRRQLPERAPAGSLTPEVARERAREELTAAGFDPAAFSDPEVRSEQRARRTDLTLRYPARQQLLGAAARHGVEVRFLGDQTGGWEVWVDPTDPQADDRLVSPYFLCFFAVEMLLFLWLLGAAILFARKYHAGEVGVRRGVQVFLLSLTAGLFFLVPYVVPLADGVALGSTSRQLTTWVTLLFRIVFGILPLGATGMLAWCVGESWARERWGSKLAAFEALFKGEWRNATVARASLRGVALGTSLVALLLAISLPLHRLGAWPLSSLLVDMQFGGNGWLGVAIVGRLLGFELPMLLLSSLFLSMLFGRRLSTGLTVTLAALAALTVSLPPFMPLPLSTGLPVWLLAAAAPVLVFWASDLLAALLCGLFASAIVSCLPLLLASTPGLVLQGCIPLFALALPLLLSLRQLHGGAELTYHWDDVPPHVRRIAERERQRVELETAREIQSSILPDLPPQLNGVALAHAYLPATEVGGDFYDVLALDDGRVALAVGDVAGHGVSSGLVMSMVRSALAVQVTFDPAVASVFHTLNRMVFQSARRRLLTTLTYGLLDPQRRELLYASAGHVFPYRISREGKVYELEAGSYPLGVRPESMPPIRSERLEPGDSVVLLSDGVIEALRDGSDEAFGFARLAESLQRHAGGGPEAMVRGVLADLEAYTGGAPREDDVTVLAARLPDA